MIKDRERERERERERGVWTVLLIVYTWLATNNFTNSKTCNKVLE